LLKLSQIGLSTKISIDLLYQFANWWAHQLFFFIGQFISYSFSSVIISSNYQLFYEL
jgi:hypothetical protein